MVTKTALVTGAASGIGLACAKLLIEQGTRVAAFDIQGEKLLKHFPQPHKDLLTLTGDISKQEDCFGAIHDTLSHFGELNAVLHWGAAHSSTRWSELTAEECNRVLEVNVTGSMLIAQSAANVMVKQGSGSIVLCTSTSVLHGVTGGDGQGGPAYVASKGAIIALTRSLARALGPKGIRVNAISAGPIKTLAASAIGDAKFLYKWSSDHSFLKRNVDINDVGKSALYLLSDLAAGVTGEIHYVDAGYNKAGMPDPKNIT